MNSKFLLILFSFISLIGCTTAYKTGQTPDDVYYSPARPVYDHIRTDSNETRTVNNASPNVNDTRSIYNNRRWRRYHDYDYGYYPYDPNYPVYYPAYVDPKTLKSPKYTAPRKVNTSAYNKNSTDKTTPVKLSKTSSKSQGSGVGNFLREIFNAGSNSSGMGNNTGNSGGNSGNTSSSNSSGTKASGNNTAPVRTFGKK